MPVETLIHTIRHAHTDYNSEKRYAGSIDVPLNEKGIQDACSAAKRLAGMRFDVVITSEKKRAIQTAQIMVNNGTPFIQSALCNERNFGGMEGHTWNEVQNFQPPILFIEVGNDRHSVNPPGGEPFEDVWQRARKFRNYLLYHFRGKSILVVSHGVFLQMFHGLLRGKNCIEALADYPANLELASFHLYGKQLKGEQIVKLNNSGGEHF